MSRILLLTGVPGVGKTTLVRRVVDRLEGLQLAGFTTEEICEGGRRLGFRIVPLAGGERTMAHVDFPGPERVGRYGVDVAAIEAVAATALAPHPTVDLYVVDEIGRMECLSERFVAEVKRHSDTALWEVTVLNPERLCERILAWVEQGPVEIEGT